jgi:hypothetical protein
MTFDRDLFGLIANGATIATALIAALAFFQLQLIRRSKRRRVEKCLRADAKTGRPWRSVRGLSIELGIAEGDIVDASHRSRWIVRMPINDEQGIATDMLLIWKSAAATKAAEEAYAVMCSPDGARNYGLLMRSYLATSGKGFSSAD